MDCSVCVSVFAIQREHEERGRRQRDKAHEAVRAVREGKMKREALQQNGGRGQWLYSFSFFLFI